MPDSITPVGAMALAPNPMQGINTLSGIYGLQQQQLGIQQQQQALQGQAAQVQQEQQRNKELQQAQQLVVGGAQQGKYRLPDGSFDRIAAANDLSQIGPYAQAMSGQLLSQANELVSNKQALQNLTVSRKNEIGAAFQGMAANANLDHTQFIDGIEKLRQEHAGDEDFSRLLTSMSMSVPPGASGNDLRNIAARAGAEATGNTGQLLPQQTTNAAGQIVNRAPLTGALSAPGAGGSSAPPRPAGPPTASGLGINPTSTQVAAATGGATGQVATDNQRYGELTNASAKAQTGIALADQVADLAKQVRTGELSKDWVDKLTILKQNDPAITARQMLAKYAAQLKTTAESGAATDSERAQIEAGMPSPESMNPEAVRDAATYLHGYFRMNQARGQNAVAHVTANGTPGLTQSDTAFMQKADPFVYAFKDMNRARQKEFLLNRYGPGGSKDPQGFAAFEQRVKGSGGQ